LLVNVEDQTDVYVLLLLFLVMVVVMVVVVNGVRRAKNLCLKKKIVEGK
jgi:hypothetical protein